MVSNQWTGRLDWTTGLTIFTTYPAIGVRSCKVEVMCRKLSRAILFWLKVSIHWTGLLNYWTDLLNHKNNFLV